MLFINIIQCISKTKNNFLKKFLASYHFLYLFLSRYENEQKYKLVVAHFSSETDVK